MSSALGERLRRLRRGGGPAPFASSSDITSAAEESPAGPPSDALARLEARLLGGIEDGLTLKERLERLVAVAARRPRGAPALVPGAPLEELIHGRRVENPRGEFFLVEDDVHLETLHGAVPLTRLRALDPAAVSNRWSARCWAWRAAGTCPARRSRASTSTSSAGATGGPWPACWSTTGSTCSRWLPWPRWLASGWRAATRRTRATSTAWPACWSGPRSTSARRSSTGGCWPSRPGSCARPRCCAWPRGPSGRGRWPPPSRTGRKPPAAATGWPCASSRCTTSIAAGTCPPRSARWRTGSGGSTASEDRARAARWRPSTAAANGLWPSSAGGAVPRRLDRTGVIHSTLMSGWLARHRALVVDAIGLALLLLVLLDYLRPSLLLLPTVPAAGT